MCMCVCVMFVCVRMRACVVIWACRVYICVHMG